MSHYEHLLYELARRYGLADGYHAADGSFVHAPSATRKRLLATYGVHGETVDELQTELAKVLDRQPPQLQLERAHACHLPAWLERNPAWGVTTQLYELRSTRNWGIGDFADLALLCHLMAAQGADFVGLTPLAALFAAAPERCSPFSPSNRRFLNPVHIAIDAVPGFHDAIAEAWPLDDLRRGALVDYPAVARAKFGALREIWRIWREQPAEYAGDLAAFDHWRNMAGDGLEKHALFEALSEWMVADGKGAGFTDWPEEMRDCRSQEVADFARRHGDLVSFHAWLQWLADGQLAEAQAEAIAAGMRIGLYADLAVGEAPDGSAVWSAPADFVTGATVGAPPDWFSAEGQEWGITALSPLAAARDSDNAFAGLIAAAARHSGALRIDHAMALWQLFLIPEGEAASQGVHVRYPVDRMFGELARLSREREFLVIGEDLGYVPPGFREIMTDARMLSYRILFFEELGADTFRSADFPAQSLACVSSHDLPTLAGWWRGDDIGLRLEYGLIGAESAALQREERETQRQALLSACRPDDCLTVPQEIDDSLAAAVHGFLSGGNALLAAVRLADMTGEVEPTNLPGTSTQYPNWRRRSSVDLEHLAEHPRMKAVATAMRAGRPRP